MKIEKCFCFSDEPRPSFNTYKSRKTTYVKHDSAEAINHLCPNYPCAYSKPITMIFYCLFIVENILWRILHWAPRSCAVISFAPLDIGLPFFGFFYYILKVHQLYFRHIFCLMSNKGLLFLLFLANFGVCKSQKCFSVRCHWTPSHVNPSFHQR